MREEAITDYLRKHNAFLTEKKKEMLERYKIFDASTPGENIDGAREGYPSPFYLFFDGCHGFYVV